LICLLSSFLLVTAFFTGLSYGGSQSPEQFVREFYQWYFKADAKKPADFNDEIFTYISHKTVEYMRKKEGNEYYVTKANSWTHEWSEVKTVIGTASKIPDEIFVVPVTFLLKMRKSHVVVFVANEKGMMRIIKITDIYPYQ